jgi:hypothetical protein
MNKCTIYRDVFSENPFHVDIDVALERIKNGKSKQGIEAIRSCIDKERRNSLKKNLPAIVFSGVIPLGSRHDNRIEHNGFMILDFDGVSNLEEKKKELCSKDYVYACFVSPSGDGLKALIRIADKTKHREHFNAIKEEMPDIDKQCANESRVCYESYDPDIYINKNCRSYTKLFKEEKVLQKTIVQNDRDIFSKILTWLSNKGNAFVSGERNHFIFKLASACCRFGISEDSALSLIEMEFLGRDSDFTRSEAKSAIRSGYKKSNQFFGTAVFENNVLVNNFNREEVEIDESIYDLSVRPKDVIFGEDVKQDAVNLYLKGYESATSTFIPEIDTHFKFKKCEITLLSGIGNYGKSTWMKYLLLMQVIGNGKKFAFFSPEDNPASEFYHDLVEMYFGMDCTPSNPMRPSLERYKQVYEYISKHIFYVYPKDVAPTPEYIKERFLELIIKEKVDGVIIDPFNQLTNDYNKTGGRSDKYLEFILSDFHRFAMNNNIYFMIVAHPTKMRKGDDGNYPCPDVFDIADGAMWNNKMDNILIYHRARRGTDPTDPSCEFHSKKIRRQKIVGSPGFVEFSLKPKSRRYLINGKDYMQEMLDKVNSDKQIMSTPELPIQQPTAIQPNQEFDLSEDNSICPF